MALLQSLFTFSRHMSDEALINQLTNVAVIYTLAVAVYTFYFPAPYGRYSPPSIRRHVEINPVIGWMVRKASGTSYLVHDRWMCWREEIRTKSGLLCIPYRSIVAQVYCCWIKLATKIQECSSTLLPVILLFATPCMKFHQVANRTGFALFVLHYVHRSFVYPMHFSHSTKRIPLSVVCAAFLFCSFNGFYQAYHLLNVREEKPFDTVFSVLGALVFSVGMVMNVYHDRLLLELKDKKTTIKHTRYNMRQRLHYLEIPVASHERYKIPEGGLFPWISCPNYLGEIIEWIGVALITRSLPQAIFAAFSFVFLGTRALHHHAFYKNLFKEEYPPQRRAIILFLF